MAKTRWVQKYELEVCRNAFTLLSSICNQGIHTAVKYRHGYHHYLRWSLKRTDSVFSGFFSQRVQIMIRICNTIVQNISAICILLRKLKTKSLIQAPTVSHVISFPISSQALRNVLHLTKNAPAETIFLGSTLTALPSPCRSPRPFLPPPQMSAALSLRASWSLLILSVTCVDTDISPSMGTLSFYMSLDFCK